MYVLSILRVVFGIGLTLVLDLKFRINSMVALLMVALSVGILAGIDLMLLLHVMKASFGNTLRELAIIMVFGAVIGKLMVDSGAAHQIAHMLLVCLGLRYVQLSMIIIGLTFGPVMFHRVAFIMLAPLVVVIVVEAKILFLKLAIPTIAAATTVYPLFPSQPGPAALVSVYGVDMGMVCIYGVLVTTPNVIYAGLILPKSLGNPEHLTPSFLKTDQLVDMNNLPSFDVSILVLLILAIIMTSTTIANIWLVKDTPVRGVVNFTGFSPIAMFIAMMVAFAFLDTARGRDMQWVMNASENTVKSIAMVILVTGAGGMLKQTITNTGIGDTIDTLMSHGDTSPCIMAWLIAVLIRLATGQGVILAMTATEITSAAVPDPATGQLADVNPALLVLAMTAGSNTLTHINGTSFWLFEGYFDLSIRDTLKTWGLLKLVNSVVELIIVLIISMVA